MEELIFQARASLQSGLYLPALLCYLTVPDACGAVEYPNMTNRLRYPKWFDANVSSRATGAMAWALRNAIMHETRTDWKTVTGFDRVVIMLPNQNNIVVDGGGCRFDDPNIPNIHTLHISSLTEAIDCGANTWLKRARKDLEKSNRLDGLLQLRPRGIHFVGGLPLIA